MIVSGDEAKLYRAVRLDSFADVTKHELLSADDQTGEVSFKDATGATQKVTLGAHAIRIVKAGR